MPPASQEYTPPLGPCFPQRAAPGGSTGHPRVGRGPLHPPQVCPVSHLSAIFHSWRWPEEKALGHHSQFRNQKVVTWRQRSDCRPGIWAGLALVQGQRPLSLATASPSARLSPSSVFFFSLFLPSCVRAGSVTPPSPWLNVAEARFLYMCKLRGWLDFFFNVNTKNKTQRFYEQQTLCKGILVLNFLLITCLRINI